MADNDTTMEEQRPSAPAEAPSTPMDDAATAADTENLPPPRLIITKMVRTKKRTTSTRFQVYLHGMAWALSLSRVSTRCTNYLLYFLYISI